MPAAIRATGFEPLSRVVGTAIYDLPAGADDQCPGTVPGSPYGFRGYVSSQTEVSTVNSPDGAFRSALYAQQQARLTALERMAGECAAHGGHGVIDVKLAFVELPTVEFAPVSTKVTATGTAVRAPGAGAPPARPFTAHLSGPDFAKLIAMGWAPAITRFAAPAWTPGGPARSIMRLGDQRAAGPRGDAPLPRHGARWVTVSPERQARIRSEGKYR